MTIASIFDTIEGMNKYLRTLLNNPKVNRAYNTEVLKYNRGERDEAPSIEEIAHQVLNVDKPTLTALTGCVQYFYILEFDNGIKFGRTKSTESRFRVYREPWCRPILRQFKEVCISPDKLENIFRIRFSKFERINREFISANVYEKAVSYAQQIIKLMNANMAIPKDLLKPLKKASPVRSKK